MTAPRTIHAPARAPDPARPLSWCPDCECWAPLDAPCACIAHTDDPTAATHLDASARAAPPSPPRDRRGPLDRGTLGPVWILDQLRRAEGRT